ncbi:MAG: peptide chain release factor N(5)-glutamine methyltransferase, partial [Bacteroidota bacterium]
MQTTPKAILQDIKSRLSPNYDLNEAEELSKVLLEDIAGIQRHQIPLNPKVELTNDTKSTLSKAAERLLANEPIQYITGKSHFYGLEFKLEPGVLIPRPETEELVDLIIREHKQHKNLVIADIGCGSGCIAISLAPALPNSSITAIDISETALAITAENAVSNKVLINTIRLDILTETLPTNTFDIIVSNPPYITNNERKSMHANVLDHEPELALFVPDDNPLKFY